MGFAFDYSVTWKMSCIIATIACVYIWGRLSTLMMNFRRLLWNLKCLRIRYKSFWYYLDINVHKKFFVFLCFLGCRLRIWNPFSAAGIENPFFFQFFPYFLYKMKMGLHSYSQSQCDSHMFRSIFFWDFIDFPFLDRFFFKIFFLLRPLLLLNPPSLPV